MARESTFIYLIGAEETSRREWKRTHLKKKISVNFLWDSLGFFLEESLSEELLASGLFWR